MSKQAEYDLGASIIREVMSSLSEVAVPDVTAVETSRGTYTVTRRVTIKLGGREIRLAIQDDLEVKA